jgi:phosphopantothenoylcysteine decarboxylase/phosphopantothenate--cysteine ligase
VYVLVTSGPSREPVDDVRYVSNVSSGRLGVAVGEAFARAGHAVVLLRGVGSALPVSGSAVRVVEFTTAQSLLENALALLRQARGPDLLIHAAAVADYAPEPRAGKLKSSQRELVLRMKPTPKVVDRIRAATPELPLIVFKLESSISRPELHRRARATAVRVGARAVVANLVSEVSAGRHVADLLRSDGSIEHLNGREEIARALVAEAERIIAHERAAGGVRS